MGNALPNDEEGVPRAVADTSPRIKGSQAF